MKLIVYGLVKEEYLCGDLINKTTKVFKSLDLVKLYMRSIDNKMGTIGYFNFLKKSKLICYQNSYGNNIIKYTIYETELEIIEELTVDKDGYIKVDL